MTETKQANIQFETFLVKESHIVFVEPGKHKISVSFTPKGYIFKDISQFHLELGIEVADENKKLHIQLSTLSVFNYNPEVDLEEYKNGLFITNAPAIVYPYLRAYINSLTALSGMPPLVLPTLNLTPLGETLKNNIEEFDT